MSLDRELHADFLFWKWAIDHDPLQVGETLCAPCYAGLRRPAKRHYFSDASFEAVGGYYVERRVYWRYDLPEYLTAELKRKAALRETCTVTINLLELLSMIAWVILELVGDRPAFEGDHVLMRGDNVAAVSWISRCGGIRDKRAGLFMRRPDRLEIKGRRSHIARHIPGVKNTQADGISRWPRAVLGSKVRELTNSNDWSEREIGKRGADIFNIVLPTKNIVNLHDELLWNLMESGTGGA